MTTEIEDEKKAAAVASSLLVEPGMTVGLGTGSTVAYLIPALATRGIRARYVATSLATEHLARDAGLEVLQFGNSGNARSEGGETIDHLDLAIDGADQVAPDGWLIKGGGGAHTREKIVAISAERFVVIASSEKIVENLVAPVPLELSQFGLDSTLRRVPNAKLRAVPVSPDNGVIADYFGEVGDPEELSRLLSGIPGIVAHGLFPPSMVTSVIVGRGKSIENISVSG